MKKKIFAAVTNVLETQFNSDRLDHLLTDAVMDVINLESKVPVMYIGKREHYSDGIWSTGSWTQEQVKLVDPKVAEKMLAHVDVYAPGEATVFADSTADVEIVEPVEKNKRDDDESLEDGREAVLALRTKKQVAEFVANNFSGHTLDMPKEAKVEDYRQEAIRLIDQYHLPD